MVRPPNPSCGNPLVIPVQFTTYLGAMESGLVTLTYIVGVLVSCICAIPLLFLFAPGTERGEPEPDSEKASSH